MNIDKMKKDLSVINENFTSKDTWTNFEKWLSLREGKQDGKPNTPCASKSAGGRETGEKSSGVKSHVDDLSADYKGHLSHNGTVDPYSKMKGKGGKAAGPVGK